MIVPATLRTFIAIELPAGMREKILNVQQEVYSRSTAGVMEWLPQENFHLTLFYLGATDAELRENVEKILMESVSDFSPFSFMVKGFGVFNSSSGPRVFWVGVHDRFGMLQSLYEVIKSKMSVLGFNSDDDKYHPHLTICKARRGATYEQLVPFKKVAEQTQVPELGEVFVDKIVYLQSVSSQASTKYISLKALSLTGK